MYDKEKIGGATDNYVHEIFERYSITYTYGQPIVLHLERESQVVEGAYYIIVYCMGHFGHPTRVIISGGISNHYMHVTRDCVGFLES